MSLELSQIFAFEITDHARSHPLTPNRLIPDGREIDRAVVGLKHLFDMLNRSSSAREGGHTKTTLVSDSNLSCEVPVTVHRSGMGQQLFFCSKGDQLINTRVTSPRLIGFINFAIDERLILIINPPWRWYASGSEFGSNDRGIKNEKVFSALLVCEYHKDAVSYNIQQTGSGIVMLSKALKVLKKPMSPRIGSFAQLVTKCGGVGLNFHFAKKGGQYLCMVLGSKSPSLIPPNSSNQQIILRRHKLPMGPDFLRRNTPIFNFPTIPTLVLDAGFASHHSPKQGKPKLVDFF